MVPKIFLFFHIKLFSYTSAQIPDDICSPILNDLDSQMMRRYNICSCFGRQTKQDYDRVSSGLQLLF